ncbi:Fatty acid oxidation complex subunit alpha [compost metagenome]
MPRPDPRLARLWGRRAQGVTFTDSDIVARGLCARINEGARLLEEGVVQRASDIDALLLNGYGFPVWRGGPMRFADRVGLGRVLARTRDFQQRYGTSWQPAPLLKRLVAEERTFAEWDATR